MPANQPRRVADWAKFPVPVARGEPGRSSSSTRSTTLVPDIARSSYLAERVRGDLREAGAARATIPPAWPVGQAQRSLGGSGALGAAAVSYSIENGRTNLDKVGLPAKRDDHAGPAGVLHRLYGLQRQRSLYAGLGGRTFVRTYPRSRRHSVRGRRQSLQRAGDLPAGRLYHRVSPEVH